MAKKGMKKKTLEVRMSINPPTYNDLLKGYFWVKISGEGKPELVSGSIDDWKGFMKEEAGIG